MIKKSFVTIVFALIAVPCFASQTLISAPGVEIRSDGSISAPGVEISPEKIVAPGVTISVQETRDLVLHNDDTIVSIASSGQDMYVSGDNNTITVTGSVRELVVNGDNNMVELENITRSLVCNGNANQLIFPANPMVEIVNTGSNNRLHSLKYSALRQN